MSHVSIRLNNKVSHHLNSLSVDKCEMLLEDHVLHEILMDQLATCPPLLAILHEQDMVATADDAVADMRRWAMAVNVGLLVEELSNKVWRCNYDRRTRANLERKYATILLGPR